jgi:glycosyltransferase involved in cell wall biosynthesis
MQGKISIVMPVKNAMPFLVPCLKSILNQSYTNWQLVAVNDHSTDDSNSILNEFQNKDNRITVLQNEGHGIVSALNHAFKKTTGAFIHRMDADDLMPSTKLEMMLQAIEPESVVTGKVEYFSDESEVGDGFLKYENWLNTLSQQKNYWADVYRECPIASPAWLMNRSEFELIGGFKSDLMPEDYDLCFRIYQNKLKVVSVPDIVHRWRDSASRSSRNMPVYYPMAYYPLKVHYFLSIDRNESKELVLIGAGKKGKLIAKLLLEHGEGFHWLTNNKKKHGVKVYNNTIKDVEDFNFQGTQIILAFASPEDRAEANEFLNARNLKKSEDYWWFC